MEKKYDFQLRIHRSSVNHFSPERNLYFVFFGFVIVPLISIQPIKWLHSKPYLGPYRKTH